MRGLGDDREIRGGLEQGGLRLPDPHAARARHPRGLRPAPERKRQAARQRTREASGRAKIPPTPLDGAVVLRPLSVDDAEALFAAHGDPRVHHYWSGPAFANVEETRRKIQAWLARDAVETWAITENDGDALGRVTLMHHRDGVAEI